ncbi:MAG: glycosyltransferase family 2 protein [Marinibacterium sp.]|nr:glycosyltransferase family 2 protein [Marinibacterium sp.]
MKIAFLTMVWRDHWLLEKWVAHHGRFVPRSQLYVINHGGDPKIDAIACGCNVVHVPRDTLPADLTRRRWDLLGQMASGLLGFFDRVVVSDVDELLLYHGTAPTLADHLAQAGPGTLAPIGLNLLPLADATGAKTVLGRYPHALVSAKYSKPCIAAEPLRYTLGGHGLVGGAFRVDPALFLCHLHFVTPDYTARMQTRRDIVAEACGDGPRPGNFWANWSDPDRITRKLMARADRARTVPLPDGAAQIARTLNQAYRHKARRVMIDPAIDDATPLRVTLPEGMRGAV